MKENIGTVQYASMLYDFYGTLLKEGQLEVMTMYHEDNLSLSEIAEELGMTRQAVHYTLKKAESRLEEYDKKLCLVDIYNRNQNKAQQALELIDILKSNEGMAECQDALNTVAELILEIAE